MKICEFEIEELNIPFKVAFQHSTISRNETESVLVRTRSQAGNIGLGEGCPRNYVTGESVGTAQEFFSKYRSDLIFIRNIKDLTEWASSHRVEIDSNPAAFSAIEVSLLNALALEEGKTVEQLLELPKVTGKFCYTAVLGTRSSKIFNSQLQRYKAVGFKDYKVKIFGDVGIDQVNLELLSNELETDNRIRIDANNVWDNASNAIQYLEAINVCFFAVEEPSTANMFEDFTVIHKELGKKIILDESFLKYQDFEHIKGDPFPWIINLRVSKMGGIMRSLAIAEQAKKLEIPIIIGAQVGETSILTRAAITVANAYKDILEGQEGAFGTHLLSYDLVNPPISFGSGGAVDMSTKP